MGLIYMRTSPSGGRYIGQTKYTEEERWEAHVKEAYYKRGKAYNSPLNRAIRKYGEENFSVEILEDNLLVNQLDEREIYWIDYYKTYIEDEHHGYNLTRGGKGSLKIIIDKEELLEIWNSGISINSVADYFNCSRYTIRKYLFSIGITSQDLIDRRTNLVKQTRFEQNTKKEAVLKLWKEGKTVTEIANILCYERHQVSNVLYLYGIVTKEEMEQRRIEQLRKTGEANSKPILQFDKEYNFIKEWPSAQSAARALGLHNSNICKVLKGTRKTTGNFIFKYKETNND